MNTINITCIGNHLRVALIRSARALAMATWVAAGTALAAPANDDFASAIELTGVGAGQTGDALSGTQTGTNNVDATLQPGEPNPGALNTVWFKWMCPADGALTVDTFGSTNSGAAEWDAILGIYSGAALNALTPLDGTPKDTGDKETMTVAVTAGTTYHIQLAGFENAVAANLRLNWNLVATIYQADILTFGPGATIGAVVDNAADITWPVAEGAPLAPTFTLSPGATCKVGGSPVVSGSPVDFSGGPVVFTVTAQGVSPIVNHYTVTIVVVKTVLWNVSGDGDWDISASNWLGLTSGLPTTFADGDQVIFNKAEGGTINIPSAVLPLATTVGAASGDYAFSGAPIAGTGSLTKDGSGTLTLNSPNTYSGATVVSGGTLMVNGTSAVGGSTSFTVTGGADLFLAGATASKKLWPETAATLTGAGTVSVPLSGLNNVGFKFDMSAFTGTLNIFGGQLSVNPAYSPGFVSPVNGTINVGNNTTLYLGWTGFALNTTLRLNSGTDNGENLGVLRASNGTLNGALILGTNSTIGADPILTINAVISDEGNGFGFTQVANGTVTLTATANTYSGPTIVNSGATLQCNNPGALGGGDLTIRGKMNLNYVGTKSVASLALGGVPQPGGTHGSTASGATYKNDTYFVGTGTVTVPASSEKNMLTFTFGALGAATIGDTTITLEVPFGTDRTNLAPTYTVSAEATGSPTSGTPRNFTSAQTYTVTAQDLSTKEYTVTVTEAILPDIFTWTTAASGDWSVAANWTNEESTDTAPLAGGRTSYTLNFTSPGNYTATNNLAAGFQLNQLNLGSAVTLAGNRLAFVANDATLPAINQGSASQVTISTNLELGSNTTFGGTGNGQVNLTGLISGAGSLTKNGAGTLTIKNVNNSFAGGTIINSGRLYLDLDVLSLGTSSITLNGGEIFLWRARPTNALIVNGGKVIAENGFSNNRFDGPITLNATLTCEVYFLLTCSNTISGVGGLTKTQTGPMILTGTNTYTGPTTVTGGTLQCDNLNALGSGALSISGTGKVNLNYTGTKTVTSLTLGGVAQTAPGTYGSVASGADFPNDTYFIGTGTVTVGGGSDYATWLGEFTFAPGADTTPTGDPDGDGINNQEEYAFGLNPTLGSSVSPITAGFNPVTGNFQYTRRATPATTKLTYTVLTSSNLVDWAAGGATETGFTTAGNIETVTVHVTAPPVGGKLFVRVAAAPTP